MVNETEVNMTKYKTLVVIIGITLIIGMVSNTGFAQSNSGSNFLHVSVHASKQADYSIDSHFVVIPPIRKEIILDKLKDNGKLIDINIIGMLPESQVNIANDADKYAAAAARAAVAANKEVEKVAAADARGTVAADKEAEKATAADARGTAAAEKDANKDVAADEKHT